jgi:CBS domain containing-hemolysin-like protein
MAEKEVTSMPVVDPQSDKVLGVISLEDMLKARARHLEEERCRQQVLRRRSFNSSQPRKLDTATRSSSGNTGS